MRREKFVKRTIIAEEREVLYRCLECKKLLCDTAYNLHLDTPSTSKHKIINLFIDKPDSEVTLFCENHYREFITYCSEDNQLVCSQCLKEEHKQHETKPFEEAFKEKKKEIGKLSDKANKIAQEIQGRADEIKLKEQKIDEATEQVKLQMETYFQEVQNFLRQRQQSLLSELSQRAIEKKSFIQEHAQLLITDSKRIQNITQEINQSLSQETALHILKTEQQLISRLSGLKPTIKEDPTITLDCDFVPDSEMTQKLSHEIQTLGSLHYEVPPGFKLPEKRPSSPEKTAFIGLPDYLGSPTGTAPATGTTFSKATKAQTKKEEEEEEDEDDEPVQKPKVSEKPSKLERVSSGSSTSGGKERGKKKKKKQREFLDD